MIVAHLSDLHLGFRAYGRVERGMDVRERDVAVAFERAVREIVQLRPEVVIVAGDIFDRPDPHAGPVVALARALESLRASLPATPVLMVAGPRDTPRRPEDPGALAVLDTFPNVEAATRLPRALLLGRLDLHAALVPYRATVRDATPPIEPDPRVRWNLLVVHGRAAAPGGAGLPVDPADWSYVALGGEHRRREVAPRVHYAGSLERVALDPWEEAAEEKGFLVADLEAGTVRFHPVPGRAVVALAPIRLATGEPERMRRRVREVTDEIPGGISGKIVRLRLDGVEPRELVALQGEPLASLRRRALHLAVEAGDLRRGGGDAWRDPEAPRLLRETLAEELERDGLPPPDAAALAVALVPEADGPTAASPEAVGHLDHTEGEVPGVGRLSVSLRPGLTAVVGGQAAARRAVADFLIEAGRAPGRGDGPLDAVRAGRGAETLDGAVRQAVDVVARTRGLDLVEAALERARALSGRTPPAHPPDDGSAGARGGPDPHALVVEIERAEEELRTTLADATEAGGDLQVATMDWHRERQDAETTLQAYRDRARELKARIRRLESAGRSAPCPTCGRILEARYDEVLAELREEWEAVVQDGSWWRRRWEQLELKPAHLRELEGRTLRMHASLEAGSERVELLRGRLDAAPPPDGTATASSSPRGEAGQERTPEAAAALARILDARVQRARDLVLARASHFVGSLSGGRVLAVTWDGTTARLEGDGGSLSPLSEEDLAGARLAVRLAGASLVAARGEALASLVVEEPFDRLEEEARTRAVALLRRLLADVPKVVLVSRGEVVDWSPELFDTVLEIRDEAGSGSTALRPVPSGPGRLVLPLQPSAPPTRRTG